MSLWKKITSLAVTVLVAGVFAFGVTGCGGKKSDVAGETGAPAADQAQPGTEAAPQAPSAPTSQSSEIQNYLKEKHKSRAQERRE